jgi:preprotein translocase subunit SecD
MFAIRYWSVVILIAAAALGFFVWKVGVFKLGLDLEGGSHLVYAADTSRLAAGDVQSSLSALQAVIERRVNAFGVGEPVVQVEQGGALGTGQYRLIVELPGVTDVNAAIASIGATPTLEFKLVNKGFENNLAITSTTTGGQVPNPAAFADTGLTGKYLTGASLQFGGGAGSLQTQPVVQVSFNGQGATLFGDITKNNVGRQLAIFLDGNLISAPTIETAIPDGKAIISGSFTAQSAKALATNLNLGALPVPIALQSTQTIGATLGAEAVRAGVMAGLIGFVVVALFMILWYRLPGVVAVVSLSIYIVLMLALFKLVPVVLTAAGIAGFILSVGLAVDANILIAERMKEELADGAHAEVAIKQGFSRAWSAIRDSNIAHIIAAVILFWFATSLIKGFALVFGLGVIVSMLSAITISRTFLLALGIRAEGGVGKFLMRSGLRK